MSLFATPPRAEPTVTLEGPRLLLRYPQLSDYDAWAEVRQESRTFLTPWEPSWAPDELSRTSFRRRLRRYAREIRDGNVYPFYLFDQADGRLVGGCTLSNIRRGVAQACAMGYWVGESAARKGYMTEAVCLLLPHIFDTLRLHRVEAACLPENEASRRLLTKIGFREEGLARHYLRINGAWRDHVLYAMLDDDPRPGEDLFGQTASSAAGSP